MKKYLSLVVFITTLFCALCAEAVFRPGELPTSLLMGSTNAVRDFIVTNSYWRLNGAATHFAWKISYVNTLGDTMEIGYSPSNPARQFSSYWDYSQYAASNAMFFISIAKSAGDMAPGTPINYLTSVAYISPLKSGYVSFILSTNLGPFELVTSNKVFRTTYWGTSQVENVVMPISGLRGYSWTFRVKGTDYTYGWGTLAQSQSVSPMVTGVPPGLPAEETTNDVLVLSGWYAEGNHFGGVVCQLANGVTLAYDKEGNSVPQYGVIQGVLNTSPGNVAFMTFNPMAGLGLTVESMDNTAGSRWVTNTTFNSPGAMSILAYPLPATGTLKFFRSFITR